MRELKIVETSGRGKTPLVVRGSLPRVFLGLGVFREAGIDSAPGETFGTDIGNPSGKIRGGGAVAAAARLGRGEKGRFAEADVARFRRATAPAGTSLQRWRGDGARGRR